MNKCLWQIVIPSICRRSILSQRKGLQVHRDFRGHQPPVGRAVSRHHHPDPYQGPHRRETAQAEGQSTAQQQGHLHHQEALEEDLHDQQVLRQPACPVDACLGDACPEEEEHCWKWLSSMVLLKFGEGWTVDAVILRTACNL